MPSGTKTIGEEQLPCQRAPRKSVSSVGINAFPGTLKKIDGLKETLSLEGILLRSDLEFQKAQ